MGCLRGLEQIATPIHAVVEAVYRAYVFCSAKSRPETLWIRLRAALERGFSQDTRKWNGNGCDALYRATDTREVWWPQFASPVCCANHAVSSIESPLFSLLLFTHQNPS